MTVTVDPSFLSRYYVSKYLTIVILVLNFLMALRSYCSIQDPEMAAYMTELSRHKQLVTEFYQRREKWNTSVLGSILFKNGKYPEQVTNKTFMVLIYQHWKLLKRRHINYFTNYTHDPLEDCSVQNCIFTGNNTLLSEADAVVSHLQRAKIPDLKWKKPHQVWIFLDDESPIHTFSYAPRKLYPVRLMSTYDIYNWSMTYRAEADIPVPYGRTVPFNGPKISTKDRSIKELIPYWSSKRRDVLISVLLSHCGLDYRTRLMDRLDDIVHVHIYGKCGLDEFIDKCPGYLGTDCMVPSTYLFYLVIENSRCKEYLTEKIFMHAYSKGAIPVIQGPSVEDCELILPPNSFIHFNKYGSVEELAMDLKRISKDENLLLSYHAWRNHFAVLNEHGYFGTKSYHYCRVCQALNYNDRSEFIYTENDVKKFLDPLKLCSWEK